MRNWPQPRMNMLFTLLPDKSPSDRVIHLFKYRFIPCVEGAESHSIGMCREGLAFVKKHILGFDERDSVNAAQCDAPQGANVLQAGSHCLGIDPVGHFAAQAEYNCPV